MRYRIWISDTRIGLKRLLLAAFLVFLLGFFLNWMWMLLLVGTSYIIFLATKQGIWFLLDEFEVNGKIYQVRDKIFLLNSSKNFRTICSKDEQTYLVRTYWDHSKNWAYFDVIRELLLESFSDKKNSLRFLLLGGGSSVASLLSENFPNSSIEVIELHERMIIASKKYFIYDNQKIKIIQADAVAFVKNYRERKTEKYDFIAIDIFDNEVIVPGVFNKDFIKKLPALVSKNGTIFVNFGFKINAKVKNGIIEYQKIIPNIKMLTSQKNLIGIFTNGKRSNELFKKHGLEMIKLV